MYHCISASLLQPCHREETVFLWKIFPYFQKTKMTRSEQNPSASSFANSTSVCIEQLGWAGDVAQEQSACTQGGADKTSSGKKQNRLCNQQNPRPSLPGQSWITFSNCMTCVTFRPRLSFFWLTQWKIILQEKKKMITLYVSKFCNNIVKQCITFIKKGTDFH